MWINIPNGTRGQNRPLVSFHDILKPLLILRMSSMGSVKKKVATFFLKKSSFLAELQPGIFFLVAPSDFL
jgi:hypothetical protein